MSPNQDGTALCPVGKGTWAPMGRTGRGSVIGNDREAALGKTAGQWKDTHPQSGMNAGYLDTVRLLLDVTPEVFSVENFAMKGGTALNFFTENMPRLSVDIDVVYTNHQNPRENSVHSLTRRRRKFFSSVEMSP